MASAEVRGILRVDECRAMHQNITQVLLLPTAAAAASLGLYSGACGRNYVVSGTARTGVCVLCVGSLSAKIETAQRTRVAFDLPPGGD